MYMLKQIFRENVPIQAIFDLLEKICLKTDKYYLIDNNSYKRMIFNEYHTEFFDFILPYYQESKNYKRNVYNLLLIVTNM